MKIHGILGLTEATLGCWRVVLTALAYSSGQLTLLDDVEPCLL